MSLESSGDTVSLVVKALRYNSLESVIGGIIEGSSQTASMEARWISDSIGDGSPIGSLLITSLSLCWIGCFAISSGGGPLRRLIALCLTGRSLSGCYGGR